MPDVPELAGVAGTGSAVIESSGQPIVAIINEDNRVGAVIFNHEGRGSTYNAILDGEQTNTVFFSQATAKFYAYSSGIQVQNVGTAAATVTAVWSAPGYADVTKSVTLGPNESVSWFAPDETGYVDFNGSVVVTADQPIVGIANSSVRADIDDRFGQNYGVRTELAVTPGFSPIRISRRPQAML
mgnify:FL=1